MKKLFYCIQALLFVAILSGCDGPKKSNTQTTNTNVVESAESNPKDTISANKDMVKENKMNEMQTGVQTIDNIVGKLTTKLALSESQIVSLRDILTKGFLTTGRELNKEYSMEESRKFKQEILHSSSDQIMALLDASQKEKFKSFIERK